jgi:hypothetical protein
MGRLCASLFAGQSRCGFRSGPSRAKRAIRDRETLAVVACESGKGAARGAISGFAIMELGDERAHLFLLERRGCWGFR